MHIAPEPAIQDVISLLAESGLPVGDISPASSVQFFGVRSGGALMAVIGLELFPSVGLLRSLAVSPSCRGRGFARALVEFAEILAASHGVEMLFLLTTTAERFFLALGYVPASRGAAPAVIQTTSEFASLCPASSSFLCKPVGGAG
ncbi:MAG: arsenic resistance N-acetyltransferase ArsN2 [Bacteroidota bacterium]